MPGGHQPFDRSKAVADLVDGMLVPGLVAALNEASHAASTPDTTIAPMRVAQLARIARENGFDASVRYCDVLRQQGVTLATIYLDLLAPTARKLGEQWCQDQVDFTEVTVGTGVLSALMQHYSDAFLRSAPVLAHRRTALLSALPGDQHTFGALMLAELFKREGWDASAVFVMKRTELDDIVRHRWIDVVGLSVGSVILINDLGSVIRGLRKASQNRELYILVGGSWVNNNPELALRSGADGLAADARQAIHQFSAQKTNKTFVKSELTLAR
jgi:MerR family transcriptional regulator, light-induced transcriptional regulator